jgi:hypothetical protein
VGPRNQEVSRRNWFVETEEGGGRSDIKSIYSGVAPARTKASRVQGSPLPQLPSFHTRPGYGEKTGCQAQGLEF